MSSKTKKAQRGKARPAKRTRPAARKSAGLVLTYANLSTALTDPQMLSRYDRAYAHVRAQLGRTYPLLIGGADREAAETAAKRTPVDTDISAVLFGPFGDLHRADKRAPFVTEGYVDINPEDAKSLGVEDGDYVWIDSDPSDRPQTGRRRSRLVPAL